MAEEQTNQQESISITRRQALTALGAGAVTLTATHLGVAYEAAQWGKQEPLQQATDLTTQVDNLKGLVQLYESLDKIGVDAIIAGAMSAYKALLDGLRGGVGLLDTGVTGAQGAIAGFRNTFATLRVGLLSAEQVVGNVAALLKDAETWLGETTTPLKPLLEQVRQFFDDLLGKIPFGVGDNIRKTIDGLVGLVAAMPDMVLAVNTKLLEPLRVGWFSDDNARNIQGTLLDPITTQVLEPLKKFLGDVNQTLDHWQSDVATPVQAALDQRADVRKQIDDYKQQHKMT